MSVLNEEKEQTHEYSDSPKLIGITPNHVYLTGGYKDQMIEYCKPHYFPLSHLTKEIRVEGYNDDKAFVPINKLLNMYGWSYLWTLSKMNNWTEKFNINELPWACLKLLHQWHFNVFNLSPSDYIDASESKVYEPKKHESC